MQQGKDRELYSAGLPSGAGVVIAASIGALFWGGILALLW